MNKKNITITVSAAVLVLAMAALAVAGPGYGHKAGQRMGSNLYSQLTPEKQAAVDGIYKKYSPKFTELRSQMLTKRATLQAMVNGGQADEKKIGKLITAISSLHEQMLDTRNAMADELEAETGLVGFGRGGNYPGPGMGFQGRGQGGFGVDCPGFGQGFQGRGQNCFGGDCPGYGMGRM
ncbi:Spy/CpxP family protein refolding chaperone [Pseudodesulfovibrio sediminis]|uniref:Zinc resistance-associated protein n=1 Tax=Pseudodesulfovibrio sediminis TaxID=2810563 RepID=A0ABN6EXC9_9BACT|nr:Spy/CpxP family protein refolding chaperone [Pseudodesulfovibrio sediminis]BCS89681.1 zinc resistance-associated protein [Pseudodesulfovibrio sediminis]